MVDGVVELVPSLAKLSLQAALAADYWRVQRRQLAYLPEDSANELLAELLRQRRVEAPQLELFQHSATVVEADGALLPAVGAGWLSYLSKFRALRKLRLLRCAKLRDGHLAMLEPLAPTLRVLSLAGCAGLTAGGAAHLAKLTGLESLDITDTHMGPPATRSLSRLSALTALLLGGLPTSDDCCSALTRLTSLQRLELWGSEVSDHCMWELECLSSLTALDLSLTRCGTPPVLPTLRQLSMIHCQLDVVGEDREALWLDMGATLPSLEELHLQSANFVEPRGAQVLRQLVCGAAGRLQKLDLAGSNVASLGFLAEATSLTYLDLAGTAIHDALLGSLALLPLRHLSLTDTGVTEEGVGQLLAMTSLTHLGLRNSQAGDGAYAVLAQLPLLQSLDLSGTEFAGNLSATDIPGLLLSLTSLALLNGRLGDRGCKLLARTAPALQRLQLGSAAVTDAGLKSLAKLSTLTSLSLDGCLVSDHGLGSLAGLGSLRELRLDNCWLVSEAGCRAMLGSLPGLGDAHLNGVALAGAHAGAGAPASASPVRQQASGKRSQRRPSARGPGATPASAAAGRVSGHEGLPCSRGERGARFRGLLEDVLQYDERLKYSREELLGVQAAMLGGSSADEQREALLALLPADLAGDSLHV